MTEISSTLFMYFMSALCFIASTSCLLNSEVIYAFVIITIFSTFGRSYISSLVQFSCHQRCVCGYQSQKALPVGWPWRIKVILVCESYVWTNTNRIQCFGETAQASRESWGFSLTFF